MTHEEAERIINPETTLKAYAEGKYEGYEGTKAWKAAVDEATVIAARALQKQISKKILPSLCKGCKRDCNAVPCPHVFDRCPTCQSDVEDEYETQPKYCSHCGQALDWSDKNES